MNTRPDSPAKPARNTTRFLLAAACGLLALNLGANLLGVRLPPEASAQPPRGPDVVDPPFNAAARRKQIIESLTALNEKVARLEARLDKGLSVKVTEMPPVTVKNTDALKNTDKGN